MTCDIRDKVSASRPFVALTTITPRATCGAASRSEMMGPGAGPVYNLKGKSRKK